MGLMRYDKVRRHGNWWKKKTDLMVGPVDYLRRKFWIVFAQEEILRTNLGEGGTNVDYDNGRE